ADVLQIEAGDHLHAGDGDAVGDGVLRDGFLHRWDAGEQGLPVEARHSQGGESRYYVILVWSAVFWQFFYLGTVGVIFCVNTLLAAILIAVFIPVTGVLGVVFFEENFSSEKGVALVLALWGLASYCYGEYRQEKDKKEEATPSNQVA
ncbi:hypothetical protein BHE74_00050294, partial [Ensete ventricosum]